MTQEAIDEHQKQIDALKHEWGEGPWNNEPDREDFRAHGLPCFVQRNNLGAWCGYVGVPPGHPMHGKDYNATNDLDVHGGVTYSAACAHSICHIPEPGEPDAVWWFGFDCAHAFDVVPGLNRWRPPEREQFGSIVGEHYRDLGFVRAETERLAAQVAGLGK